MKKILLSFLCLIIFSCAFAGETSYWFLFDYIKKISPNAKMISKNNLSKYCGKIKEPDVISGDFNGDGLKDHAAYLKSYEKEKLTYWIVVFLGAKNKRFKTVVLMKNTLSALPGDEAKNFENIYNNVMNDKEYVYSVGPGEYKIIPENGLVKERVIRKTQFDSVGFAQCEGSSGFYYWDIKKRKFIECWTSD